ncbi:trypsin alpha-3-like [Leguminivora glycinivorella]|uniref:trypsin alpha-3-like n=1 Tax=Leguminivora glycinivorella TaxID=1035111 RepID=UPI00200ED155|nr:trypsin alpha-3-like [Leguminivora glycinivorella]
MKLLVALALVGLVGSAVAEEWVSPVELDYHNKIGIPAAARIKAAEQALDFDGARIVGGSAAHLGQYPYLGGLVISLTSGGTSVCGSSLLSNTRSVTAAHCWRNTQSQARSFTIVWGSTLLFSGGTRVSTSDVEMHASYNMQTLVNDVAIIRHSWVTYNNNIHNINLSSGSNLFVGSWAWAAGFGATSDSQLGIPSTAFLSHVTVQVVNSNVCLAVYGGNTVQASTLCVATTGGRGTCGGDSGGPLVIDNQLIGITSFGHVDGCQRNHPAGFVRVSSFASWLWARM